MPGRQSRRWTATLNNYTEANVLALTACANDGHLSYMVLGKEVAASGTPHLQMYLELPKKKTLQGVKTLLGLPTIHLEIAVKDSEWNLKYCSKGSQSKEEWNQLNTEGPNYGANADVSVFGVAMLAGTKKVINRAVDLIQSGLSVPEIVSQDLEAFLLYGPRIEKAIQIRNATKVREAPPEIKIYIGESGTGKTRKAHEEDNITWTHAQDRWFDGYEGQESVLFDDFEGYKTGIPFRKLLRLLDRYPIKVPVKGGFANWVPKKIVITTNVEIENWYPEDKDISPLWRRIREFGSVTRFTLFRNAFNEQEVRQTQE